MKHLKLLSLLAFSAAIVMIAPPCVHAQIAPTTQIVLTTSTNTIAASGTAVVTSQAFSPNSLTGFAVVPNFSVGGTNNNTSNVSFYFQTSLDGVNWSTTFPYSFTVAATGTTPVVAFNDFPPALSGSGAQNIPWIRLGQVINSNTGGAVTLNSITVSKSNR